MVSRPHTFSTSTSGPIDKNSLRFKFILLTLFMSLFLSAMELTALSTAAPRMIHDLHGTTGFFWVGTASLLAATASPMSGGVAEIFGRQPALITALGIFGLGSVLCGTARNTTWGIIGRTVQGIGSGAIQSLSYIIVSDLVSLQERGTYNAILGLAWAVAATVGPLVGGSLAQKGLWRWLFYLNLPVCGVAIIAAIFLLRLPKPQGTLREKLQKMDWIGNFLVIASSVVFIIGLSWGGSVYPWSSFRVIATLTAGFFGFIFFLIYEANWASNPIVPFSLLSNRSSVSGYIQNFTGVLVLIALDYFFSIYTQVCKDATPIRAGLTILPASIIIGISVIITGVSVAFTKQYRPQLWLGWILVTVGFGFLSTLSPELSYGEVVGRTLVPAAGIGIIAAAGVFPVLAPLDVSQNAHALAFFTFGRSFAGAWAVSIGNTIFENELTKRISKDPELDRALTLLSGSSKINSQELYGFIPQVRYLPQPMKETVQRDVADSLNALYLVLALFGAMGLVASLPVFMRNLPLQDVTDERWTRGAPNGDFPDPEREGGEDHSVEALEKYKGSESLKMTKVHFTGTREDSEVTLATELETGKGVTRT